MINNPRNADSKRLAPLSGVGWSLLALGALSYVVAKGSSLTALIPAAFGAVLLICALAARHQAAWKTSLAVAAVVSLLGSGASLWRAMPLDFTALSVAKVSQLTMGVLLLLSLVWCLAELWKR